ncbi:unnamed protein product [Angiostrongylus costaricensis]|uniref:MADF domain-containing protein n=1 Tax=Angiostrongylus costaricensis TaxID=334426 RepID=A0A158PGW7_ANGCS|nr:unnamed protein product [Angiostrongylus costaricensis]
MSFQPAFNARLIAEVKKHPCLYNHSKRGSGDTMERMRIWENIASAVDTNCSGDFAKKRWLQLRDRYRKELKTAIKQNFVTPVRWCYFSHLVLSTCDGYSENGDSFSNCVDALGLSSVKAELDDDDSYDQNVSGSGVEEHEKIGNEKSNDMQATEEKCDRQHQYATTGGLVDTAGKSALDWINDEDFLYCRIIGLRLKKLEPRKKKRIRAQIMSLLEESEGELEEDDDSMSSTNVDGGDMFENSMLDVSTRFGDR